MRYQRILALAVLALGVFISAAAFAASGDDAPIVVVDVSDPLDQRSLEYIADQVSSDDAYAYILQIDSPGVSSGDLTPVFEAIVGSPVPVISWVGPFPAVAYGGAAYIANHADLHAAAPGTKIGYLDPAVQRGREASPSARPGADVEAFMAVEDELASAAIEVATQDVRIYGFVDVVEPSLGQLVVALDGVTIHRAGGSVTLSTARTETINGTEVLVPSRPVQFTKPGLLDRFLRLGARPETAFLFLVFGLAFAIFEFYAAGAGLMAFVASLSLIIGGYGLATLPVRWASVALLVLGMGLLVWGFAQNRTDWRAAIGTVALIVSGLTITTSAPAYPPAPWLVLLAVAGSVLFIWYSLTTVVRGRFATPTVGREAMLGQRGVVVEELDPLGVVLIDGARWRATADRGVTIAPGAPVEIVGVTGLLVEVDPLATRGRE